jgi:hypothetical protein
MLPILLGRGAGSEVRAPLAAAFGRTPQETLITNGTDEAIQLVMNTFVEPGERVIVSEPTFAMYRFYASVAGAVVVDVPPGEDLRFPLEAVRRELSGQGARAVFVANPNNPTGTGISLDGILKILRKAQTAAVLIDEAYFEIRYTGKPMSIASFPGMAERTVILYTFSKKFAMTGWRLGWLVSRPDLARKATQLNEFIVSHAPSMAQKAAEDCRSPRRERAATRFRVSMRGLETVELSLWRSVHFGDPLQRRIIVNGAVTPAWQGSKSGDGGDGTATASANNGGASTSNPQPDNMLVLGFQHLLGLKAQGELVLHTMAVAVRVVQVVVVGRCCYFARRFFSNHICEACFSKVLLRCYRSESFLN